MLHEGLGSVSAWKDWPKHLSMQTGLSVFAYSRRGYGRSDPHPPPWPLTYMHEEAALLPQILDDAGIHSAILLGHSDGGSIALIHAGTRDPRLRALILLAPHVFCEPISVESIAKARDDFLHGDLRRRLAKHHDDVDGAFWGWNRAWLDPDFMRWNIEEFLPQIEIPVLAIQGDRDPYGTIAQIQAIQRGVRGRFESRLLHDCGHSPHRDQRDETTSAIASFLTPSASERPTGDR